MKSAITHLKSIIILGRRIEIENIWENVTYGCETTSVTIEQLPSLLSKLDETADKTALDMEQERCSTNND